MIEARAAILDVSSLKRASPGLADYTTRLCLYKSFRTTLKWA